MSDFTEADVEAAINALDSWWPRLDRDEIREVSDTVLAAVAPAMRDRWLTELADEIDGRFIPEVPDYAMAVDWIDGWEAADTAAAELLRSKRSGGDQ